MTTTETVTLYHGAHGDTLTLHPGICLTDSRDAATEYGPNVFVVEMSRRDYLAAPHLGDGCLAHEVYLGDADLDSIDWHVIRYDDETMDGRTRHETVRMITAKALTQLTII